MTTDLPEFRYHPDPISTGSIAEQPEMCECCGQRRTHTYLAGPPYAIEEIEFVCPWCIADGSAAAKFDATFVDGHPLANLADAIVDEITRRTPSFLSWQQERWESHCDDGCAFIDRVGTVELAKFPVGATEAVREALKEWGRTDEEREQMFGNLHRDGNLSAYLFKCLHCDEYKANIDAS